jgi:D-lyxose ketol-isomerase
MKRSEINRRIAKAEEFFAAMQFRLPPEPLRLRVDGSPLEVPAGGSLVLSPGESVCLEPRVHHRFPEIEEDEAPYRLLVPDYPSV